MTKLLEIQDFTYVMIFIKKSVDYCMVLFQSSLKSTIPLLNYDDEMEGLNPMGS